MQISPNELINNGFRLIETLQHKELIPFVKQYLNKPTKYKYIYFVLNFSLFAIAGFLLMTRFLDNSYVIGVQFSLFVAGIFLALLLLPLHEFIHVLAYKWQGAKNTSYAANIKKFYFMALADKFVANRKEFTIVALAPFICISVLIILGMLFINNQFQMLPFGALLAHTAMCSGDFGMLSFFAYHKKLNLVTFDDVANGVTYFYAK